MAVDLERMCRITQIHDGKGYATRPEDIIGQTKAVNYIVSIANAVRAILEQEDPRARQELMEAMRFNRVAFFGGPGTSKTTLLHLAALIIPGAAREYGIPAEGHILYGNMHTLEQWLALAAKAAWASFLAFDEFDLVPLKDQGDLRQPLDPHMLSVPVLIGADTTYETIYQAPLSHAALGIATNRGEKGVSKDLIEQRFNPSITLKALKPEEASSVIRLKLHDETVPQTEMLRQLGVDFTEAAQLYLAVRAGANMRQLLGFFEHFGGYCVGHNIRNTTISSQELPRLLADSGFPLQRAIYEELLLRFFADHPGETYRVTQILAMTSLDESGVRTTLTRLVGQGFLATHNHEYLVPENQAEFIEQYRGLSE